MAQPRRVLVLRAQPESLDQHQPHLRRRTRNPDRLLGLPLERQPRALRLDQTRRRDPRQSRPRTSHPRPDHNPRHTTSTCLLRTPNRIILEAGALLPGEYDVGLPPQKAAEYAGLFEHAELAV